MLIADLASEVIIHSSAFSGETSRALKEKEERLYGSIERGGWPKVEAWERMGF
jgi:hypothetical protein